MVTESILDKTKLAMVTKKELKEFIILGIRILFFIVFMFYGVGKLTGGQFGNLTPEELNTPIKELSLFKIGWYLFDHQPFKAFIGISQIVAACLLLFNRTFVLGLLILTPIILNILIIDLTIMPYSLKVSFLFRLSTYLLYIAFIIWYFRYTFLNVWNKIRGIRNFENPIKLKWKYAYLIIIVPLLTYLPEIFMFIYGLVFHTDKIIENIQQSFK